ncbi:hypothetical protein BDP27DRAFT_1328014 [Rhodocollybia butyracea]|uniref:Uncharacterized protein n=1 Tax=Rhodocollybia butyracea TaxID=206335 RepID=A0A9P5PTQ3_9AGAR|nr:hypothetical protein BDP27DRAFT_1328014 [Rhodocollybia butyracea]
MSSPNMITRSSRKRKLSPDDHVSQVLDQDADCAQVADTTGARKKKKQDVKGKGKARAVSVSASLSETGSHQVDHDEGEWEIPVSEYADLESRVFETVSSGAGDSGSASGSGSSIGETSSGPQTQPDLVSSSSNTLIDSASNLLPSPTSRAPTALAMDHSLAPPSVIPSTTNDTDQDEVDEIAGALENIDRGSSLEPVGKETQDPSLQPTRAHSRSRSTRKARAPVIELAHIKEEQFEPTLKRRRRARARPPGKVRNPHPDQNRKSKKAKKAADGSAPSTSTQDEPPSGQSTKRMRYVFARDAAPAKRKKLNAPTRRKVLK